MVSILDREVCLSVCEQAHAGSGKQAETDQQAFDRWTEAMSEGDFERGWRVNDELGRHWPSAHLLWDGRSLRNRNIVVRSLHGLGDAVQMMRYAPRLRQLAQSVCYEVPRPLQPLMPYFNGVVESASPRASCDVEIEMMELPYLFRVLPSKMPFDASSLRLPSDMMKACGDAMGRTNKPRIGVVWAGGEWDRERWIPFDVLRPLLRDDRFEWWNLQGSPASAEAANSTLRMNDELRAGGLVGLAATMANLDLVLTVDTLAAHIAGALGVPTWLMLKRKADWRWMTSGCNSPWYPSLRIFRQATTGCWDGVMEEVGKALHCLG